MASQPIPLINPLAVLLKSRLLSFARNMKGLSLVPYPEQKAIINHMADTLVSGKIGFIEAPTGSGKTLAIAHSALETVEDGVVTVIAVPSLELAQQTISAIKDILSTTLTHYKNVVPAMIVGRNEFLCPSEIEKLAETLNPPQKNAVITWVQSGAPGRSTAHPCWTFDGLRTYLLAKDFDIPLPADFGLKPTDKTSSAFIAYDCQFALSGNLLVVTHAMLGVDMLSRFIETSRKRNQGPKLVVPDKLKKKELWNFLNEDLNTYQTGNEGKLPDFKHLIVDEAHLFQSNIHNVLTDKISFHGISNALSVALSSKAILKKDVNAFNKIQAYFKRRCPNLTGGTFLINLNNEPVIYDSFVELHDILKRVKLSILDGGTSEMRHASSSISKAKKSLVQIHLGGSSVQTRLIWSKIKLEPSFSVSRKYLMTFFDMIWHRLDSAVLISATMFTKNVNGESYELIRSELNIKPEQAIRFGSIKGDWIIKPVSAFWPSLALSPSLRPVEANVDWVKNQSIAISKIKYAKAQSKGVLVLSRSLDTTAKMADFLTKYCPKYIVMDGSVNSLSMNKKTFIDHVRAGKRVIWVAQGPAWTGLDLPDDVLGTLVITALPWEPPELPDLDGNSGKSFGGNNIYMIMRFKQAIGRLVRIRNASQKALYVLDDRLKTNSTAKSALDLFMSYNPTDFS